MTWFVTVKISQQLSFTRWGWNNLLFQAPFVIEQRCVSCPSFSNLFGLQVLMTAEVGSILKLQEEQGWNVILDVVWS